MVKSKYFPTPRIRLNTSEELRTFLLKPKALRKKKNKRTKLKRLCIRRPEHHKLLVLLLRYGSTTNFEKIQMSWAAISRATSIP